MVQNRECLDRLTCRQCGTPMKIVSVDANSVYRNLSSKGEPQLGPRGLFRKMGGNVNSDELEHALLWVLNFSDGEHSLLDISERSGLPFEAIRRAADALSEVGLLDECLG